MTLRIRQELGAGKMTEKEAYDIAVQWVTHSDHSRSLTFDQRFDEIARLQRRLMTAREEMYIPATNIDPVELPIPVEDVREVAKAFGPLPHHAHAASAADLSSEERQALAVSNDAIACLECGTSTILLKTHLSRVHRMSPAVYRERWGLDSEFPFAPPSYSARKRAIAAELGLGDTLGKGNRSDDARRERAEQRAAAAARREQRNAVKIARDEARRRAETMPVGTRLPLDDSPDSGKSD